MPVEFPFPDSWCLDFCEFWLSWKEHHMLNIDSEQILSSNEPFPSPSRHSHLTGAITESSKCYFTHLSSQLLQDCGQCTAKHLIHLLNGKRGLKLCGGITKIITLPEDQILVSWYQNCESKQNTVKPWMGWGFTYTEKRWSKISFRSVHWSIHYD